MNNEIRWKQRFGHFTKAYEVFMRRIEEYEEHTDEEAYQMALIQGYEILIELAWKVLKDYLTNEGYDVTSPKEVIRKAYQNENIKDGDVWIKALENRNLTSHVYNPEVLQSTLKFVHDDFAPRVNDFYFDFKSKL